MLVHQLGPTLATQALATQASTSSLAAATAVAARTRRRAWRTLEDLATRAYAATQWLQRPAVSAFQAAAGPGTQASTPSSTATVAPLDFETLDQPTRMEVEVRAAVVGAQYDRADCIIVGKACAPHSTTVEGKFGTYPNRGVCPSHS
jgi:hypothetical protein